VLRRLRRWLVGDRGFVVWLTGLPCSGKTTMANLLAGELRRRGRGVLVLDGDAVRGGLSSDLAFGDEDRAENLRRLREVARLAAPQGLVVVVAAITPYESERLKVRTMPGTLLAWCNAPVAVCERRDVKGMWARARKGEIEDFTGVDGPYDQPATFDVQLYTDSLTETAALRQLWTALRAKGWV